MLDQPAGVRVRPPARHRTTPDTPVDIYHGGRDDFSPPAPTCHPGWGKHHIVRWGERLIWLGGRTMEAPVGTLRRRSSLFAALGALDPGAACPRRRRGRHLVRRRDRSEGEGPFVGHHARRPSPARPRPPPLRRPPSCRRRRARRARPPVRAPLRRSAAAPAPQAAPAPPATYVMTCIYPGDPVGGVETSQRVDKVVPEGTPLDDPAHCYRS